MPNAKVNFYQDGHLMCGHVGTFFHLFRTNQNFRKG